MVSIYRLSEQFTIETDATQPVEYLPAIGIGIVSTLGRHHESWLILNWRLPVNGIQWASSSSLLRVTAVSSSNFQVLATGVVAVILASESSASRLARSFRYAASSSGSGHLIATRYPTIKADRNDGGMVSRATK